MLAVGNDPSNMLLSETLVSMSHDTDEPIRECNWQSITYSNKKELSVSVHPILSPILCAYMFCVLSLASTSVKFQYDYIAPMPEVNQKASLEDAAWRGGVPVLHQYHLSSTPHSSCCCPGDSRRNILPNLDHACHRQPTYQCQRRSQSRCKTNKLIGIARARLTCREIRMGKILLRELKRPAAESKKQQS